MNAIIMPKHSLFSPSAAHRWMVCAPSITAPPGRTSLEAAEGSVAHDMASTALQTGLDAHQVWQAVSVATHDGYEIAVTDDMRGHVQRYLDYVRALGSDMMVERRFQLTEELGGTADAIVLDFPTLHVVDFKYGKGVRVAAEQNPQMMLYALFAVLEAEELFPVEQIVVHVHQPRVDNISSWSFDRAALREFQARVNDAMQLAKAVAERGPALLDYVGGEHCKFCSLAGTCPGLRTHALANAQKVFSTAAEVPQSTLGEILREAEVIDAWIAAVRKEALDRALRGEVIDGFKLVDKRPMRKWIDEARVQSLAIDNAIDVMEPPTLASPAAVEKRIGRDQVVRLFGNLIQSVSSGLTLVPDSDKRAAVNTEEAMAAKAAQMFT